MKGTGPKTARRLLAVLALLAPAAGLAEPQRFGYCAWASPATGREAFVSAIYPVPAQANSVRLARSFADYIIVGGRDRPRHFTPMCFTAFETEEAARAQRNHEVSGYRERGFTLQVVGGWTPP